MFTNGISADLFYGFHSFGQFDLRLHRTVGLLVVAHFDYTQWCGYGTFNPLQVAQVGLNADSLVTGRSGRYAEYVLRKPCRRTRRPTVRQAVAVTLVAVVAVSLVYVDFARRRQFVDAGCIFEPVEIEIFPEGGGAQVEHA